MVVLGIPPGIHFRGQRPPPTNFSKLLLQKFSAMRIMRIFFQNPYDAHVTFCFFLRTFQIKKPPERETYKSCIQTKGFNTVSTSLSTLSGRAGMFFTSFSLGFPNSESINLDKPNFCNRPEKISFQAHSGSHRRLSDKLVLWISGIPENERQCYHISNKVSGTRSNSQIPTCDMSWSRYSLQQGAQLGVNEI